MLSVRWAPITGASLAEVIICVYYHDVQIFHLLQVIKEQWAMVARLTVIFRNRPCAAATHLQPRDWPKTRARRPFPAHILACCVASGIENGPFLSSFFLSATRRRSGCSTGDDQRWHPSQLDPPPGGGACACRYLRFYQLQPAR